VRERWATFTNDALREGNIEARVDHRSLKAQGIDREPRPRIPVGAWYTEQHGQRSEIADRIRAAYRERVQARLQRAVAQASSPGKAAKLDDIRLLARQSWMQLRELPVATLTTSDFDRKETHDAQEECDIDRKPLDDDLAL
jgi:hypothetical protein